MPLEAARQLQFQAYPGHDVGGEHWQLRMISSTKVGAGLKLFSIRLRNRASSSGSGAPGETPLKSKPFVSSSGVLPASFRASNTSSADSVKIAPWRIKWLVPLARGSTALPGTAKTSRFCSSAIRAVIREPERGLASTMTTPLEMPEIRRLRAENDGLGAASPARFRKVSRLRP